MGAPAPTSVLFRAAGWLAPVLALLLAAAGTAEMPFVDDELVARIGTEFGDEAGGRLLQWRELMETAGALDEREKLERVNRFFNRLNFVSDLQHWGQDDYWATPVEFLATDGGDCEDFSLGKYFTLKALGVPEDKMRLTYVKALQPNAVSQAHMVLTYYPTPEAIPLVLDNLIQPIRPATSRTDLVPVYSFNGAGLWIAKQRGLGVRAGDSSRLSRWTDLLQRFNSGDVRKSRE
jgi:predicted transglutaminase-like cysteine proteinase